MYIYLSIGVGVGVGVTNCMPLSAASGSAIFHFFFIAPTSSQLVHTHTFQRFSVAMAFLSNPNKSDNSHIASQPSRSLSPEIPHDSSLFAGRVAHDPVAEFGSNVSEFVKNANISEPHGNPAAPDVRNPNFPLTPKSPPNPNNSLHRSSVVSGNCITVSKGRASVAGRSSVVHTTWRGAAFSNDSDNGFNHLDNATRAEGLSSVKYATRLSALKTTKGDN